MGYYLERDEEKGDFILYRRDDAIPDNDITLGGPAYEMALGVAGLDILFENARGEEFTDWNTLEGDRKDTLPSLIRITLLLKDQKGKDRVFMTSVHPELAGNK